MYINGFKRILYSYNKNNIVKFYFHWYFFINYIIHLFKQYIDIVCECVTILNVSPNLFYIIFKNIMLKFIYIYIYICVAIQIGYKHTQG